MTLHPQFVPPSFKPQPNMRARKPMRRLQFKRIAPHSTSHRNLEMMSQYPRFVPPSFKPQSNKRARKLTRTHQFLPIAPHSTSHRNLETMTLHPRFVPPSFKPQPNMRALLLHKATLNAPHFKPPSGNNSPSHKNLNICRRRQLLLPSWGMTPSPTLNGKAHMTIMRTHANCM